MNEVSKKYMLVVDEIGMAIWSKLCPTFSFVPIEGMPLQGSDVYHVLVSPVQSCKSEEKESEEIE